jgi:NADPH:quinone reductase-like Zn-dependent oxidoreductase
MMKAIVQDSYGSTDVLELRDIATPAVTDRDVLVKVRAASVNPPDWCGVGGVPYIVRAAFGLRRPRVQVRGTDMAGVVEAVGEKVTRSRVGDEVFGVGLGTFAEYATAKEGHVAPKPANLSFEAAAAIPMAGLTALHALRDAGGVRADHNVLITGAGGGIGTFAVQIAKAFGANVTAVCSAEKADLVRSLGADRVFDYTRQDFTESEDRYDMIFDNVLAHPLTKLRRLLQPHGTLVPNGGQFHKRWIASTGVMLIKAPLLSRFGSQKIRVVHESPNEADLLALADLAESGMMQPVIGEVYPLADVGEAIDRWGSGHARGKLVIAI